MLSPLPLPPFAPLTDPISLLLLLLPAAVPVFGPRLLLLYRLGASELHVVASVMGGMAAQEAIKLLTGQFVPFR
jgi:hypothetical protein